MRRLALLSALFALELSACKHKSHTATSRAETNEAAWTASGVLGVAPTLSIVKMSDPQAEGQLVRGFYGVESHSWRWTASKFAVALRPPPAAGQHGANLEFKFSLPEVIVNKVGPVTLSSKINGRTLSSQTYSTPGDYTYTALVAPEAFPSGSALLEFSTDKAMSPTDSDKRELALVAVSVALEPR